MQIKFHGPIDRVTGSCYELYEPISDKHFLIDCGMYQGEGNAKELNQAPFPFDPRTLDFVVLTHAHLDHCGRIPLLYKQGFTGKVYATEETRRLAILVLKDAVRCGAPYASKYVESIIFQEHRKALFGLPVPVAKDLFIRFFRSSHLLGATSVTVLWGSDPRLGFRQPQRSITFSGDLGPNPEDLEQLPLLRHVMTPTPADYAVVESTYGGRVRPVKDHQSRSRLARLNRALREGLSRGGPVIIPAFALGRTQDLLFDLHLLFSRHIHFNGVPVYLDGPMALKASLIYAAQLGRMHPVRGNRQKPAWMGKQLFRTFGLKLDDADNESLLEDALREMLDPSHVPQQPRSGQFSRWRRIYQVLKPAQRATMVGPCIILTSGGMCSGGPVQEHLSRHLTSPTTTVLLTGYCADGTVGQNLARLGRLSRNDRRRLNELLGLDQSSMRCRDVMAKVQLLSGYSAHADQRGLLAWLFFRIPGQAGPRCAGQRIFITHGTANARRQLATAVDRRARKLKLKPRVDLPNDDCWFDLDEGRWVKEEMSVEDQLRAQIAELRRKAAG